MPAAGGFRFTPLQPPVGGFHFAHCQPQPWQPTQECFLGSAPLLFPPGQRYVLRSVHPRKKATKAPPPFNGAGKNKSAFAHGHVLTAGSSHSFNRSPLRSFLTTQLTNSFRSPHQLQHRTCKWFVALTPQSPPVKFHSASGCFALIANFADAATFANNDRPMCLANKSSRPMLHSILPPPLVRSGTHHPHLPHPRFRHFRLFLPAKCSPLENIGPNGHHFIQHWFNFQHAVEMRITPHAPPGASYFPFQQHIIIIPEI